MKNAMQLKALVKKIANDKNISTQLVLQNYMLERFLERLSVSEFKTNFVIKGGFLISSIVGINSRTTMDIDTTLKNYPANKETIEHMIESIIKINIQDNITFLFKNITEIREKDDYTGYRVSLNAKFLPLLVPLKIDITTGDKITPKEIEYTHKLMFEDRNISFLGYNLSTILAEKLETIISRGDQNTRPRDFYDIYILSKLQIDNIDYDELKLALENTTKKRGSNEIIKEYRSIMDTIKNSYIMKSQWNNYKNNFDYASEIDFSEVCDTVKLILEKLYNK